MKKRLQGLLMGVIIGVLLTSSFAFAKQITTTAQLFYNDIKITLNGKNIEPKDANGVAVEPFVIDGTTYFPLRAIANALGITVGWDGSTSTVVLTTTPSVPFTLSAGQYVVGEDILPGKYECLAIKGSGNFMGEVASLGFMGLNEILAAEGHDFYENRSTYSNLRLAEGDVITIHGDLVVEFTQK